MGRHLTMVAWAVVMQDAYTQATVRFLRAAYTWIVEGLREGGVAGLDQALPHLDQLSLIRTVLCCDPRLQDPSSPPPAELQSVLSQTALEVGVTESFMQLQVADALRCMGLGKAARAEVV